MATGKCTLMFRADRDTNRHMLQEGYFGITCWEYRGTWPLTPQLNPCTPNQRDHVHGYSTKKPKANSVLPLDPDTKIYIHT